MRLLSVAEEREIQLNILVTLQRFCNERGLSYFLCAGTLLGAIRHNGYIPWDDDLDVMMPRRDYDRLLREYVGQGPSAIELLHPRRTNNYPFPFAKLSDPRTAVIEKARVPYRLGVHIDIFPVDGWLPSPWCRGQRVVLTALHRLLASKLVGSRLARSKSRNLLINTIRILSTPLSIAIINRSIDATARLNALTRAQQGGVLVWGYREAIPTRFYKQARQATFEGLQVPVPSHAPELLELIYGDYMKLSVETERMRPHDRLAYRLND